MFKRGGLVDGAACEKHVAEIIEAVGADIHTDPVLNNACAVDLRKFCRDITPGDGRMFACLVRVSKEKSFTLEKDCQAVLNTRVEMFGMAVKVNIIHFCWLNPIGSTWRHYICVKNNLDINKNC